MKRHALGGVRACSSRPFTTLDFRLMFAYTRNMTQPAAASRPSSHEARDLFLRLWAKELPTTRKVLERIPEGSDYRPDPKSRTAREIAWLIVREQMRRIDALEGGEIRWTEPPPPATVGEVLALDDRHRGRLVERLQELPAA